MSTDQTPPAASPVLASWPGLLPWQHLFCACALGMLAWQWPLPATTALALYMFATNWTWDPLPRASRKASRVRDLRSRCLAKHFFQTNLLPRFLCPLLAFLFGLAIIQLVHPQPSLHEKHASIIDHRQPVTITGSVAEVRARPGQLVQIILKDVVLHAAPEQPQPLRTKLLWNWQSPPRIPTSGQEVRVSLRIRPIQGMANPGMSRSEEYWARQGIFHRSYTREQKTDARFSQIADAPQSLREELRSRLLAATPPGQGQAMLLALLMGDRYLLDPETMDLVQRASLAHSLALSGMHLGFVVSMGWLTAFLIGWIAPRLYLYVPRPKLAVLLSTPLVLSYLWLGQAVPSLTRAALMFASWGILLLLNRQRVLVDGLFLAVVVILFISPLAIFDLRLQLSVLAVAGLALIWPLGRDALRFTSRPWWQKPLRAGLGILAVSIVATLALLPLQAWFFGRITPHVHLNVLWLPMLGLIVFPLGLTGLLFLLLPGVDALAAPLLGLACAILQYMLNGLLILDDFGLLNVFVPARPLWPQFLGYWMLPLAAVFWWKQPRRIRPGIILAAVLLLMGPALAGIALEQRRIVTLRMLDVSQGQALLLELPGGKRWLVDGGGFWTWDYDVGQAVIAPTLAHGRPPRLNGIALSHADFDHYRGLFYPLRHFQIKEYASQGRGPSGHDGQLMEEILTRRNIPERIWRKGDFIRLGRDVGFEVLHPDDRWIDADKNNDASLVMRLVWKDRPLALLTGDVELASIVALLENAGDLRADVLIIPHHGSRTSHAPELYRRVEPRIALVSSGFLNRFNHPHPEIVRSLQDMGIPLYNSSEHGAVTVRWNNSAAPPTIRSERRGRIERQP